MSEARCKLEKMIAICKQNGTGEPWASLVDQLFKDFEVIISNEVVTEVILEEHNLIFVEDGVRYFCNCHQKDLPITKSCPVHER